jgi:catechol 2,3-dioxygenase-like lactoylglutathione lyase family enzyme
MTEPAPVLSGYHHVTLNVQDVEQSAQWYSQVLGFTRLTNHATDAFHRVILAHPSGVTLGVNRHESPEASERFSERRAGLDHLAFRVANRSALEEWIRQLDSHSVPHSEIKPAAVPGAFLVVFRDPDGIQLEVFSPPARVA